MQLFKLFTLYFKSYQTYGGFPVKFITFDFVVERVFYQHSLLIILYTYRIQLFVFGDRFAFEHCIRTKGYHYLYWFFFQIVKQI